MAAVELDPVFVKALKLLHSRAKDSSAQLKAMLDDAIAQRKGLKVPSQSLDSHSAKASPGRSKSDDDSKKKDADKRPADKMHKDSSEPDIKKLKLDSKTKSRDEREAREKEKEKERLKREKEKKAKEERDAQKQKEKAEKERREKELASRQEAEVTLISDEEEPSSQMDAGDFALEMGIACVVCRQFDVSSGNQLVECQECHSLYHQECHKPPVTEEDVSDPRFVWYCSRCTKSLKKMVTQKAVKLKPPSTVPGNSTSSTVKESVSGTSKSGKAESSSSSGQAFRRIDPKTIVTPKEALLMSNTTSKPMVGLEGLAANLAKPRGESKSGSSRKSDQKGDSSKSSSKPEGKSSSGNKSDSSSKSSSSSSSSSKNEERKAESKSEIKSEVKSDGKGSSKDEKEKKSSSKSEEKKSADLKPASSPSTPTAPPAPASGKEDKKLETTARLEPIEASKSPRSPSHLGLSKLEVSVSTRGLSPQPASSPTTPESPSSSKSNLTAINKQAVANLSMVTANKRMQMMKKKAQTKPEKKIHIK